MYDTRAVNPPSFPPAWKCVGTPRRNRMKSRGNVSIRNLPSSCPPSFFFPKENHLQSPSLKLKSILAASRASTPRQRHGLLSAAMVRVAHGPGTTLAFALQWHHRTNTLRTPFAPWQPPRRVEWPTDPEFLAFDALSQEWESPRPKAGTWAAVEST